MSRRKFDEGFDFEALRRAIEHCDPDAMLGFYAEEAQLSIVNADAPHVSPFELRGKAEITKHLRAVFGQEVFHRVERGVADENRVMFREACEYPDGCRSKRRWRCTTEGSPARRMLLQVERRPIAWERSDKDHPPEKSRGKRTRRWTLVHLTVLYAPSRQPKRRC
jgi:SnoaL-like domain